MTAGRGLGWPGGTSVGTSVGTPTGLGWPGGRPATVPRETVATAPAPVPGTPVPRGTGESPSRSPTPDAEKAPDVQPPPAPIALPSPSGPAPPATSPAEPAPPSPGPDDTPIAAAARVAARLRSAHPADAFPRPARTRVMVIANQKGGVGKTTTTVNLGAALALHGQRVLIVDLDPQGNASTALGIDHPAGSPSVYESVIDGRDLAAAVRDSPGIAGLRVVPATIDLAGAEIELVPMVARELRLRRAITAHLAGLEESEQLDYVLIDCPPSLGLLTLNALVAADEVLIPIQCEYYALEGLGQLVQTIDMVTSHLNEGLRISTILLTMYDARTRLAAQVADEVRAHFADRVLSTAIPRSVRVSEAPSYGQTVLTYDPGSSGSLSYIEAARELAASLPR